MMKRDKHYREKTERAGGGMTGYKCRKCGANYFKWARQCIKCGGRIDKKADF